MDGCTQVQGLGRAQELEKIFTQDKEKTKEETTKYLDHFGGHNPELMLEIQLLQNMVAGQEKQLQYLRLKLRKKAAKLLKKPKALQTEHDKAVFAKIISEF